MARNPVALVAALKLAPPAKDQFQGGDFPGSYLWQRGGLDPEQYRGIKQTKYAEAVKLPKISIKAKIPKGF